MKKDIFIGGAWPYANYYLHVGHLAALLPGDVLARYFRGTGANVFYVSGSDAHGTPITQRAKKENTTAEKISSFYHEEFKKTFNNMNFSYDLYSSTDTKEHKEYVTEAFKRIYDNGYIYPMELEEDYCPKCEMFLNDRDIEGICPLCGGVAKGDQCENCFASLEIDKVKDKHCKICGTKPIKRKNKHLYFKLTDFSKELEENINLNKDRWRKNAVGEALKFLHEGLIDRAVSRELDWGIPVPIEGFEEKKIYVWIEAVLGYLSTSYLVAKERNLNIDDILNDNNKNLSTYFIHGKDNIPFHTIIYPALLLALKKNYRLPDYILSSGYVNLQGEKMSKSKGNLITVNELLEIFPSDSIRFFFILNGPETKDVTFSKELMKEIHNKFLVGSLGNFINRNLSFINKKFDGIIKEGKISEEIIINTKNTYKEVGEAIEKGEFRESLNKIINYINLANKYYDERRPWEDAKNDIERFNDTTYTCTHMIANLSNLIYPFMPNASAKIKEILNLDEYKWEEISIKGDIKINNLSLLFNRFE